MLNGENDLKELRERYGRWERENLRPTVARFPERRETFITASSEPVKRLYTPLDLTTWITRRSWAFPESTPIPGG